jgi:small subunit ribosomal protein S20
MQRHTSAKKEARKSKKNNAINRELRSRITTALRRVFEAKNKKDALKALNRAYSVLDKSVKVKLIHPNNADNKKTRLSRFVNQLTK